MTIRDAISKFEQINGYRPWEKSCALYGGINTGKQVLWWTKKKNNSILWTWSFPRHERQWKAIYPPAR